MATTRELMAIQAKLDKWELEHLREHAAALHCLLEGAHAEIERLKSDLQVAEDHTYFSDARAEMFLDAANALQDQAGLRIGITRQGQMGVLAC